MPGAYPPEPSPTPAIALGSRSLASGPSAEQESLFVVFGQPEADRTFESRGWGDQLPQRLEDFVQLLVVLAKGSFGFSLEIFEAPLDRGVRGRSASQLNERSHDCDVVTATAVLLRSTPDSIATPCSVKT
jgi:hypothetical protein